MFVHIRSLDTPTAASYSFFFNHTATTEIYTLSLHDALPISAHVRTCDMHMGTHAHLVDCGNAGTLLRLLAGVLAGQRSEEHTSELQSHSDLVCRLLLEKKKKKHTTIYTPEDQTHTMQDNEYV